jgi:hypothetical protein
VFSPALNSVVSPLGVDPVGRVRMIGEMKSFLESNSIRMSRFWGMSAILCLAGLCVGAAAGESSSPSPESGNDGRRKELFTGQVVRLSEALKRRDIPFTEEMREHVVLETPEGELIPILADWRGRAFYQDERLRDRPVELVGTRAPGLAYLQVLMVFTFNEQGERQYTDYWCDVCAIPMYQIQPCECCQDEIRLRYQKRDLPEYLDPQ